jgi:hypothetical protein
VKEMKRMIQVILTMVILSVGTQSYALAKDVASSENGRFQLVFSPTTPTDKFLVDTQTGKVWQLARFTDVKGNPVVWQYMYRIDNINEQEKFAHEHGIIVQEKSATPQEPEKDK